MSGTARASDSDSRFDADEITCIGCGCADSQACSGACSWTAVDYEGGLGICSNCAAKPLDELLRETAREHVF